MPKTKQYKLAKNISLTDVDEEIVLLDLNTGHYFGLNRIGAEMLRDLLEGKTIQAASSAMAAEHDIEASSVQLDLQELVAELVDYGLIVELKVEQS